MKTFAFILVFFSSFTLCVAQDAAAAERLRHAMQDNIEKFRLIEIHKDTPTDFEIDFAELSVELAGEGYFGGFRFVAPEGLSALDMVWYFNIPQQWTHWYLWPVEGPLKPSFQRWVDADKVYGKFDQPKGKERYRALQELSAGYFESGKEYIMWFRRKVEGGETEARGRIVFHLPLEEDENWDVEGMEEALDLQPLPAEAQVAHLDSRGGRIMLDSEFFKRSDAVSRIDDVFMSLRRFQQLKGGFFMSIETSCPPCRTTPIYADIRAKYGEADFVRDSSEVVAKRNHRTWAEAPPVESPEINEENTITYYYDHFGFIVGGDDSNGEVIQVNTHAENYGDLAPSADGGIFSQLGSQNLTVFYLDQKEVGRMYYFLEESKIPFVVVEPPAGEYRYGNTLLEYRGSGDWMQSNFNNDGERFSRRPFVDHQIEGNAQWFFPDGKVRYSVDYQDGVYHGDFVEYDEEGEIVKQSRFEHGQPL